MTLAAKIVEELGEGALKPHAWSPQDCEVVINAYVSQSDRVELLDDYLAALEGMSAEVLRLQITDIIAFNAHFNKELMIYLKDYFNSDDFMCEVKSELSQIEKARHDEQKSITNFDQAFTQIFGAAS